MTEKEMNHFNPRTFPDAKPMTRDEVSREFFKNRRKLKAFQDILKREQQLTPFQQRCIYTDLPDGRHWFQGIYPHPKTKGIIMNFWSPYLEDALPLSISGAEAVLPLIADGAALIGTKADAIAHWLEKPYDPNAWKPAAVLDLNGNKADKALNEGRAEYVEDEMPDE